jgi:hypothetical protein
MSWLALQISTLTQDGGISTQILLGAQNVVFASDATRNARFLSPAALRATSNGLDKKLVATLVDSNPTPAVGWWFRDNINDTDLYPRTGALCHSPGDSFFGLSYLLSFSWLVD